MYVNYIEPLMAEIIYLDQDANVARKVKTVNSTPDTVYSDRLDQATIHETTRNGRVRAVIITPAHRESDLAQTELPMDVLHCIHINDHPLSAANAIDTGDHFYTPTFDFLKDNGLVYEYTIDGTRYAIRRDFDRTSSPIDDTTPKVLQLSEKDLGIGDDTHKDSFRVIGPIVTIDGTDMVYQLSTPGRIFHIVDAMLRGRTRNTLFLSKLIKKAEQDENRTLIIDSSLDRSTELPLHSIGRARMLPVLELMRRDTDLQTPIIWNDADAHISPQVLEKLLSVYEANAETKAVFLMRRPMIPEDTYLSNDLYNHALSELTNSIEFLSGNRMKYMGGPQISSRLSVLSEKIFVEEYFGDTAEATLLHLLFHFISDEDFAFADALLRLYRESIIHLDEAVWVTSRGKDRNKVTAISGDAGTSHEHPQLIYSEKDEKALVEKIQSLLEEHTIDHNPSVRTVDALIASINSAEFNDHIHRERTALLERGLPFLQSRDIDNSLSSAIQYYALQRFIVGLTLRKK